MDESHKHVSRRSQTKERTQCDAFYMKFKGGESYSVVLEVEMVVTLEGHREGSGGKAGHTAVFSF